MDRSGLMFSRIFGAVLMIAAVLFAAIILRNYEAYEHGVPGPALMPLAALVFIALGGAGMALKGPSAGVLPWRQNLRQIGGALALLAFGATYAAAMPILGFVAATAIFVLLTCLAFGGRRPLILIALAALVPLALHYGFTGIFNLPLPEASFLQE